VRRPAWLWFGLLLVSLGVIGGIAWDLWPPSAGMLAARSRAPGVSPPAPPPVEERRHVRLFLVHAGNGALVEQVREIPRRAKWAEDLQVVLRELAKAGEGELRSPLPQGFEVRQAFLDAFGILYLDGGKAVHALASGPTGSDLPISAIVLTLTSTFGEIKRVQFLSEGQELAAMAGGVDLRRPISPRFPGEEAQPIVSPPPVAEQ